MQTTEQALAILDKAAAEGSALARSVQQSFSTALGIARIANTIRNALSPALVQELIVPLQNVDFGWRTDSGHYTIEQIRDCWVSAALAGARPINNEVTIIQGRTYLNQNYFRRMVRECPGVTDVQIMPGKILTATGGATVEMIVTYKLNGKDQRVERVAASAIPVRLNAGMGADGAIGKATRKVLKQVYERLTGSSIFHDSDDDDMELVAEARVVPDTGKAPEQPKSLPTKTATVAAQIKPKTSASPKTQDDIDKAIAQASSDKDSQGMGREIEQSKEDAQDDGGENPWDGLPDSGVVTEQTPSPTNLPTFEAPAAPAQATPAAEAPKEKKKRGGFVRDTGDGTFREVDVLAPNNGPKVVVPSASADLPPQAEPVEAEPSDELGSIPKLDCRTDIFVEKVVRMKGADGATLYFKTPLKESTDVFGVRDQSMAEVVRDKYIIGGKNGEMFKIWYSPENLGGIDVNIIQKIEAA